MIARLLTTLLVFFIFNASAAFAETKIIIAEATYIMGDGETPSFAEAMALQKAKQTALEEAGTYVQSYTKVQNLTLTTEEIQTLAGGVLQVEVLEKTRTLVGDAMRCYTKIKATVTTDKMEELSSRIKGQNVAAEYKKLQDEYARLSREVEMWKQRAAKAPQGPEHDAALDQIRERERDFARVQQNEAALFQRLVSGQALVVEAHDERAVIDQLIEWIKSEGHEVEIKKVKAFASGNQQDRLTLTVPITVTPSLSLFSRLTNVAQRLDGEGAKQLGPGTEGILFGEIRLHYPPGEHIPGALLSSTFRVPWRGITVVRLSKTQTSEKYFQDRIREIVLVLTLNFDNPRLVPISCRMPFGAQRLVVAHLGKYKPTSVLVLNIPANLEVEFDVSTEVTKRIDRVTTRWVDKSGAPLDLCRIAAR